MWNHQRRVVGLISCIAWMTACGGSDATTAASATDTGTGTGTGTTAVEGSTSTPLPTTEPATTESPTATSISGDATGSSGDSSDDTSSTTADTNDTTVIDTTAADPFCGDAMIDLGEVCDDGPANGPGQPCNAMCQANACGDGDQGPGEECDDGANNGDMNSCKADCTNAVCGDGLVGPGEGCDDGNQSDNDECTNASAGPGPPRTGQLTGKLHGRKSLGFSAPRPAAGAPGSPAVPPGFGEGPEKGTGVESRRFNLPSRCDTARVA